MLIVTIFEHTLGRQRKNYIMNIAKIFCRALKLLTRDEQNCKGTERDSGSQPFGRNKY